MAKFNLKELQKKMKDAVAKANPHTKLAYNTSKIKTPTKQSTPIKKKGCGCGGR